MRIAYVCADPGIPLNGSKGASVHVRAVADALGRRDNDVHIIAVRDAEPPPDGLAATASAPRFDPVLKRVKGHMRRADGPTLASESQGLLSNSLMLAALEEEHRRIPFDAVYERYSLWSTAGLQFARQYGLPFGLEVNAPLVREQERYRDLVLRGAALAIEQELLASAEVIFVPSAQLAAYVQTRVGRCEGVIVVPNAADVSKFSPAGPRVESGSVDSGGSAADRHRLRGRFVIAFVGSLKPWHGVEVLLEAFERLLAHVPEAHLLVVGDGPLRSHVTQAASRLGDDRVTATGPVGHSEVAGWLQQASVGIAPYPPIEDFYFSPLKVVEYMAAGLPVVASDIGQLRELVVHGETGLLVEPGDVMALGAALCELETDRAASRRMGEKARRRAERRHGWDGVAAVVEKALEERGGGGRQQAPVVGDRRGLRVISGGGR